MGGSNRPEWQIQTYIGAVVISAVILTGFLFWARALEAHPILVALLGTATLAQLASVSLFGPTSVSLSFPFTFLALLWFGPTAAILTNVGPVLVHAVYPKRRPLNKVAFNFGSLSLAAGLGGVVYLATGGQVPPDDAMSAVVPTLGAASVYFLVNTLTVSGAIALSSGQPVLQIWSANHRWLWLYYGAMAFVAMAVAALFQRQDVVSFLVLVPALTIPWAFTWLCVYKAKELAEKKRRVNHLSLLQQVSLNVNDAIVLEEACAAILNGARALANVDRLGVFLWDSQQQRLAPVAWENGAAGANPSPEEALSTKDLEVLLSSNGQATAKSAVNSPTNGAKGTVPVVTRGQTVWMPLRVEHRTVGVAGFAFKGAPQLSEERANLLHTLAQYLAGAAERQAKTQEAERSHQRVFEAEEAVRKEVATSLHGPVQTRLLALWYQLGQLPSDTEPRGRQNSIGQVRAELRYLQEYVRSLSSQLHPSVVSVGLLPALRSLADRLEPAIQVELTVTGMQESSLDGLNGLSANVKLILYRVAEEALNNVAKHANVSRAMVRLWEAEDKAHLSVQDHGQGFRAGDGTPGLGLRMIQDLARAGSGTVKIDSAPGGGTTVCVSLPLSTIEAEEHANGSAPYQRQETAVTAEQPSGVP